MSNVENSVTATDYAHAIPDVKNAGASPIRVGVIGYGPQVGPALGGALAGRTMHPVSEIDKNPLRVDTRSKKVDDGAGGVITQKIKVPIWFEPIAKGKTPMCAALDLAWNVLNDFVMEHAAYQGDDMVARAKAAGFDEVEMHHDMSQRERWIVARIGS